jgi:formamidopyrimidine-DNA glycosylase
MFTIGKNIFIRLTKNQLFNLHLGMTGGWSNDLIKHCHFRVSNGVNELFFKDVRKFGKLKIINQYLFDTKFNTSYDCLNPSYNTTKHLNYLDEKVSAKKSICSVIMNQKYFPGIGNYVKSESLYAAKIHPEEKWGNLNKKIKLKLIHNISKVMESSYQSGGAELKDFKNPFKVSSFDLKIYGKKYTEKKNLITSKTTSDSRTTWFCPKTQILMESSC